MAEAVLTIIVIAIAMLIITALVAVVTSWFDS